MKKYIIVVTFLVAACVGFSQNNNKSVLEVKKTEVVTSDTKSKLKETPNGFEQTKVKKKRQFDLSSGIAVHPDDIVSDDIIVEQIKAIENAIAENKGDEKVLFQLNKDLVNLKAKRNYLKENNLN